MKVLYRYAPLKKKVLKANYSSYIGVIIEGDLSFKEYVASLCKKTCRKLSALYELLILFFSKKKNKLIKISIALLMIYLKRISLSLFNIKSFAIELLKLKESLSNTMMHDVFSTRVINYNLRS